MGKITQFFTWILDKAQKFNDWEAAKDVESDWSSGPSVNIDGSPMVGSVDIHGNPYGVTSQSVTHNSFNDY